MAKDHAYLNLGHVEILQNSANDAIKYYLKSLPYFESKDNLITELKNDFNDFLNQQISETQYNKIIERLESELAEN